MSIKKIQRITFLMFFLTFSSISLARANIFFSDFYIGAGSGNLVGEKKYKLTISDSINTSSFDEGVYFLNIGFRPVGVPLLSNFRVQSDYIIFNSHQGRKSEYGITLYNDFLRIIPILNPYVGLGLHNAKFSFMDAISSHNLEHKKYLYSLHLGLTASLIVVPMDFYLEYRYSGPFDLKNRKINEYDKSSLDFIAGVRLYIGK